MKKRTIRLLRGGLWLLLCAALTLCALSLRSEAPPREDVDAASRMLVSSSELLYDADSTSQIDSSSLSGEAEEPPPPEQPAELPLDDLRTEEAAKPDRPFDWTIVWMGAGILAALGIIVLLWKWFSATKQARRRNDE